MRLKSRCARIVPHIARVTEDQAGCRKRTSGVGASEAFDFTFTGLKVKSVFNSVSEYSYKKERCQRGGEFRVVFYVRQRGASHLVLTGPDTETAVEG